MSFLFQQNLECLVDFYMYITGVNWQQVKLWTDTTVLTTAKFTSFSLMPQNENANFHARKRIILKTKAQIRKFITANETPNARKRKHANETSNARKRKHTNETPKAHTYKKDLCIAYAD